MPKSGKVQVVLFVKNTNFFQSFKKETGENV